MSINFDVANLKSGPHSHTFYIHIKPLISNFLEKGEAKSFTFRFNI